MSQADNDIKTRILLSARKLFAKQGFEGTTVRQICEDAGANVALVSYHFGGKEKVFEAIFQHFFSGNMIPELEDQLSDPVVGLRTIIEETVNFSCVYDKELSFIIQQEMTMNSPRKAIVNKYLNPVWTKVKELLQKGKDQGIFHFDSLSYTLLMVMGVALAHKREYNYDAIIGESDMNPLEIADQTVAFIFKGLGVQMT
ncbi:TetR family transcriptional regulator [Paenibacillus sp. J22TS3]|uniref:TetR family transcriptional regulator n=1 Tax=Paenibacillus sp. J22TS3 TaxID=2807192 RepID=UPI001B2ED73A|nr:TetR family transcriptional regulator [Paenibacillus sp. J22TS3]GIP23485.1 TetR family transcriptional regulator [Paenibacillus sp. J22TS3]